MGTFVQDSFTDTDATNLSSHTGETGATWAKLTGFSGNVVINSNRAENAATFSVDAAYYASGTPSGADYDVSADYSWVNTNTCSWQILGRVDTSTGDFYTAYYRRGSNTFRIEKRVSGSYTTLASGTGGSPAAETAVNIKLTLSGSGLELFADSVSKLTATDSSITAAGKVGVGVTSGGTTGPRIRWDNFLATEADGGVSGTGAGTLSALTAAAGGAIEITGDGSAALASLTGQAAGHLSYTGAVAAQIAAITGAAGGHLTYAGTGTATLSPLTAAAVGSFTSAADFYGVGIATLTAPQGSAAGQIGVRGTGSGTLTALSGLASGRIEITGVGAGDFPQIFGAAVGTFATATPWVVVAPTGATWTPQDAAAAAWSIQDRVDTTWTIH